jgi:DNA-binding NarL/FixJ family response regulator
MTNGIRVLWLDDDERVLRGGARALRRYNISVRTAKTLPKARESIARQPPDVVLLDEVLDHGERGSDLIVELQALRSPPAIVLLTGHFDAAVSAKLRGKRITPVTKPFDALALAHLIHELADALPTMDPIDRFAGKWRLSQREAETVRLLCNGLSDHQIAARLGCAVSTVATYVDRVYDKCNIPSRRRTHLLAMVLGHVGSQAPSTRPGREA